MVKPPRVESEDEVRRKAEQKALRESAQVRAEYLRDLLGRRLPKATVTALVFQAFVRSANQAPAKAACDLLGLEAPNVTDDPYGARAVEQLTGYAGTGDAQLQRAALALAFALAEEHMGASSGAIGWARPASIAHLRFLEDAGYQRNEFEEDRLAKAAEALEQDADDRRRWRDRRAEADLTRNGVEPNDGAADDEEVDDDDVLVGEPA